MKVKKGQLILPLFLFNPINKKPHKYGGWPIFKYFLAIIHSQPSLSYLLPFPYDLLRID